MSYDARRRALLTESGGAGITYGKDRQVDSTCADVLSQAQSSATLRTGAIVRIMRQPWEADIIVVDFTN